MANVLVTGGAGYIGSHTCKALARAGHTPIVFDTLGRGNRHTVKWGPLELGDLLDRDRLAEVLGRNAIDTVIHFAAFAYVGESVERPDIYYRNNVVGSLNLIDAMVATGVKQIVFSSTCAAYGIPASSPIVEDMPLAPINPYGASKVMVERMLADYGRDGRIRSVVLRYFTAAGADPEGEIGEDHDPETHALPLAIMAALGTGPEFKVFGSDYDTPDGSAVRDYIHVADLAHAHMAAMDHLDRGGASDTFNLGTGIGTSVLELIAAVEDVTGTTVPRQITPRRPGDPGALVASPEKAGRVLGWTPEFTDFREIVRTAVPWFAAKRAKAEAAG